MRHGVEGAASTSRVPVRPVGARPFVVEEEEGLLVAPGRDLRDGNEAANVPAELIEFQIGPGLTVMVAEPVVGVVIRVAVELVRGAVEVLRRRSWC